MSISQPKFGIGAKLFLAFGVTSVLTVIAITIGWLGFEQVASTQQAIIKGTIPSLRDAQKVAAVGAHMAATAPALASAKTGFEQRRVTRALQQQKDTLYRLLGSLQKNGFDQRGVSRIRRSVEQLVNNLVEQSALTAQRIDILRRQNVANAKLLSDASVITELSGSLVANAASGATAVASSMYKLVETNKQAATMGALDRLIEVDLDAMERMFELRVSSSAMGALISQLSKEKELDAIDSIQQKYQVTLKILSRRVNEINDPGRKEQATRLLNAFIQANAKGEQNIFLLHRRDRQIAVDLNTLQKENNAIVTRLNSDIGKLVGASSAEISRSTLRADQAVTAGRTTFIVIIVCALVAVALILWLYLQRNVIRRLMALESVMRKLADGNNTVVIDTSGHDELAIMARTVQVFRENAIAKDQLEHKQKQIELELREHKSNLEIVVNERTEQLQVTNRQLAREAEQHSRAREIAEKANRAKTDFLATMSHELRTPLSGILGTVTLLFDTRLTRKQRQFIEIIANAGQGLLNILNDILGYSQMEAGKLQFNSSTFDLQEIVADIISLMKPAADKKHLELSAVIDAQIPYYFHGDPGRIRQILLNLLGNSIKFTDQGSVSLHISGRPSNNSRRVLLNLAVRDTGPGIPGDLQESIFEAFTQVDSSISRRHGGIGLGLAICKRLVIAMGGSIQCHSTLGTGTTISVHLELDCAQPVTALESDIPDPTPVSGLAVLLVEDDEVNRLIARSFLEKTGNRVTEVTDGLQAVAVTGTQSFDVILMDISLPGMDGVEAIQTIRSSHHDVEHIPIIAMSAHVFPDEVDHYINAGANGFLGKPIDPGKLLEVLHQVTVERSTSISMPKAVTQDDNPIVNCRYLLVQDAACLGLENLRKMVDMFLATSQQTLTELLHNCSGYDVRAIQLCAHKLKGAALSVGLSQLASQAERLEHIDNHSRDAVPALVKDLEAIYQQSRQWLRAAYQEVERSQSIDVLQAEEADGMNL